MRILKIIIASYIGSNIGFLFGEYVIVKIAGEQFDMFAILTAGVVDIPPVLMGSVLSGLVGTIAGVSFIKKGKIRAVIGGSGAFLGLAIATLMVYNINTFFKTYYLIYPLFVFSGWELGMYAFRDYLNMENPPNIKKEN